MAKNSWPRVESVELFASIIVNECLRLSRKYDLFPLEYQGLYNQVVKLCKLGQYSLARLQGPQFCSRKNDHISKRVDLTLHPGSNLVQAVCGWDLPKIDLTTEKTLHPWTLQAGCTERLHSVFFIRDVGFF